MYLKRLNAQGMTQFAEYIDSGAKGPAPVELLDSPATSEQVSTKILLPEDIGIFPDRYVFGNRMVDLFKDLDPNNISRDEGLWSALALFWFDAICPVGNNGRRKVESAHRYILSPNYNDYYRHLVCSPWRMVRIHGENARFLLIAPKYRPNPLSVNGEIFENFLGRQKVAASRNLIKACHHICFDPETSRPKTGLAGRGPGCASRFGLIFRQFDLTYDIEGMPTEAISDLLPPEFNRWKQHV